MESITQRGARQLHQADCLKGLCWACVLCQGVRRNEDEGIRRKSFLKPSDRRKLLLTRWRNTLFLPLLTIFQYKAVTIWQPIRIIRLTNNEKQNRNKISKKQHFRIFLVSYCFFRFCWFHFVVLLKILSVYRTVFSLKQYLMICRLQNHWRYHCWPKEKGTQGCSLGFQ